MKDICPVCNNPLLRHFHQQEVVWFCSRCRQEMPNLNMGLMDHFHSRYLQSKQPASDKSLIVFQPKVVVR